MWMGIYSTDGCRLSECRAARNELSDPFEFCHRLGYAIRRQADLASDFLQFRERQTVGCGKRLCRTVFPADGELEDLSDFVIVELPVLRHSESTVDSLESPVGWLRVYGRVRATDSTSAK